MTNALDQAITSALSIDVSDCKKLGEVPYDFTRKRLTVFVKDGGEDLQITKGAFESVLSVCTRYRDADIERELTEPVRARIGSQFRDRSAEGFRVLGLATKQCTSGTGMGSESESEMTFEGSLHFFDPPKADAGIAIEDLKRLGVGLKIITGDNRHVAAHVAREVGLTIDSQPILTGSELQLLTDEALIQRAEQTPLFAEVDPNQKERVIRSLQKAGHVVGYMGDGINDATALYDADVGISVDGAVDVAREAADFVLMKKGLDAVRHGIEEGRVTFANSLKYIFTTTSANFGNMLSMAAASVFLPFLPLLATQILLNNFLSDIPAIAIANDNVDPGAVAKPRRWEVALIRNFMIVFGLVSSVFDLLLFGILIIIVRSTEPEFHTAWFTESLLTELAVALVVRTRRPFYRSRPGRWLFITTLAVAAVALALPYIPYSAALGFVPLPPGMMILIVGVTFLYVMATEGVKSIFYRRMSEA